MEFTIQPPTNPVDRRRHQNRIAQRKFRQKRDQNLAATSRAACGSSPLAAPAVVDSSIDPQPIGEATFTSLLAFTHQPDAAFAGEDYLGPDAASAWSKSATPAVVDPNHEPHGQPTNPPPIEEVNFASLLAFENQPNTAFASEDYLVQLLSSVAAADTTSTPDLVGGTASAWNDSAATALTTTGKSATPWLDDGLNPAPYEHARPRHLGSVGSLHIAAQKGNERILRLLLQHHSNANDKDSDGRTPLMHATMCDHVGSMRTLLAHGARIGDTDNESRSSLHWAVLCRRHSALEVLLDYYSEKSAARSCDINACDDAGWSPLHMAIDRGFEAGVVLLLGHGANVHTKAHKGPYAKGPSPAPAV
ncbi:uncharacterized protein JN550_000107 [Neoarthrinium moseri]|uniref:uncharacterized protein n=1 Tax=Neoarthrinium moseri TaxID=1658444 RepID=UPI001FDD807B|nr:uncharacterized protein JN550_000107 [Neoarthrinium moseri]KAI1877925.1 hypothetical protein JN550_000107 [Neoarthrinium moseri]